MWRKTRHTLFTLVKQFHLSSLPIGGRKGEGGERSRITLNTFPSVVKKKKKKKKIGARLNAVEITCALFLKQKLEKVDTISGGNMMIGGTERNDSISVLCPHVGVLIGESQFTCR
ncbi:hypothetical protein POVWA2_027460 [Plasmodium ovale wallikeri]|uniref:Uncharacterized protein n=1 Tax=Plasmodium ovale wallikeri TaxID=864142 RepID=A0A1A8YUS6_PLAOA|nr:hypothetical protein POVWA1_027290 [Plasmodium ovale wallikeri]SBT35925.1 hypothetical protein POVWA2_027460 [Plasmodium ovale wallikeri]